MDANPPQKPRPEPNQHKPFSFADTVFAGLLLCLPVGMFTVPFGLTTGNWWLVVLTPAAGIALVAMISSVNRAIGGNKTVLRGLGAVALTLGTAAGAFIVWFGVHGFLNADVCDPRTSRCGVVINGVMSGESTESVGSQLFGAFLLSLGFIVPGLLIIGFCIRTAVRALRQGSPKD